MIEENKDLLKFNAEGLHPADMFLNARKVAIKAVKQPEEKTSFKTMPLGPNGGNGVSRPADYDAGFKVLRKWVDENGGPPEEIRQKLRELWIDYEKAPQKTTRYSARKKGRHKI